MPKPDLELILSTAPEREVAERIAQTLVKEKLAACVQLVPGLTSFYIWEGRLERSEEILILAKSCRAQDCLARLSALHPYDVPEGLILPIKDGLAPYLDWARAVSD